MKYTFTGMYDAREFSAQIDVLDDGTFKGTFVDDKEWIIRGHLGREDSRMRLMFLKIPPKLNLTNTLFVLYSGDKKNYEGECRLLPSKVAFAAEYDLYRTLLQIVPASVFSTKVLLKQT